MLDRPRQPGEIATGPELCRLLGRLRAAAGVQVPAELDIGELRDVELAIGSRLADDLLAVFAAHLLALEQELEWRLGLVVGHTGAIHRLGARGDLVALGHQGQDTWYCVEPAGAAEQPTRVVELDARGRAIRRLPLFDWLAERLGAGAPGREGEPLRPRLVARALESTASGRRVRHKVFGEGRVLAEIGDGPERKVKAEFPGRGLVLLAARFLEFVDG